MERVMLRHVNQVTAKGKRYWYHRVTLERLPDEPNARALRVLEINKSLAPRSEPDLGSVADLIQHFKGSPSFTDLAKVTRRDYARIMDQLGERFGDLPVSGVDREFVLELRDSLSATPRHADYTIAVLRRLLAFAIDRPSRYGLTANPAARPGKLNRPKGYQPWPVELVEAVRAKGYRELVDAMELGLYTGQRASDCVAMVWTHYDGRGISVAQAKTAERLWIPVHPALKARLDAMPRRAAVILATKTGVPWSRDHLCHEVTEAVRALGFDGYSFHGLRKLAGKSLAEAGCSAKEIMAVLGHRTLAMAELYSAGADQKRLATAAIHRLATYRKEGE